MHIPSLVKILWHLLKLSSEKKKKKNQACCWRKLSKIDEICPLVIPSQGIFCLFIGAKIRPHSQRQISSIFPNFIIFFPPKKWRKKKKNATKKKKETRTKCQNECIDWSCSVCNHVQLQTTIDYTGYRLCICILAVSNLHWVGCGQKRCARR